MRYAPWAVSLISWTIAGAAMCGALVSRRRTVAPLLLVAFLAVCLASLAWAALWGADRRIDSLIAAVALSVAAGAGGYALAAATLGGAPRRPDGARARREAADISGPRAEGLQVVLLADTEPEEYEPWAVTAALARYDDGDIDLPPEIARPLVYASERARYRRSGGSPARGAVRGVAAALEDRLRSFHPDIRVTTAYCTGGPALDQEVEDLVARGAGTIIVAPLSAAWSPAFSRSREALPDSRLDAEGVAVEVADPLWASPHLSAMIAARTLSRLGGDRSGHGVVLISEGDPWEHAATHVTYREQLTFLIQRVRAELVAAGVSPTRIERAWLWLEAPDIAEAVRHLAARGARTVAIVPVTIPVDTLATRNDLQFAAEQAAAETGASVAVLPTWGEDPAVVEALADAVLMARRRLEQAD